MVETGYLCSIWAPFSYERLDPAQVQFDNVEKEEKNNGKWTIDYTRA